MSTGASEVDTDAIPGYETDADSYYYEDEPRGEHHQQKSNKYGLYPRTPTLREKRMTRAYRDIRGKPLGEEYKIGDKSYQRKLEFGPGAQELTRIVAGLGRGVKKVNGTQTLDGAKEWIKKHKADQYWAAYEQDITGPKGHPDGVKEVIVTDKYGNVKIVNGYTLCGSDYPWRKAYYTKYPTEKDRKQVRFSEFKTKAGRISGEVDEKGNFLYQNKVENVKRHKITAKQAYKQLFFSMVYKEFAKELEVLKYDAMSKARLNTAVFNYVYGILFEKPAILAQFDDVNEKSFDNMSAADYKEEAKDEDVKSRIAEALAEILKDEQKKIILYISTAQLVTYALVKDSRLDINAEKLVLGIKAGTLVDFKAMNLERGKVEVQETVHQEVEKRIKDKDKALENLIKDRGTA